jgi:hypothetical protein
MEWTKQEARAWAKTWDEPHMVKGLKYLKHRLRAKAGAAQVTIGFDLTPVFVKTAGNYEGRQEVFDEITRLGNDEIKGFKDIEFPEPYGHINEEKETEEQPTK